MSKPLVVNIPHNLGRAGARQRLVEGLGKIRDMVSGKGASFVDRWEGDRLTFEATMLAQKVAGRLDVEETNVRVEVDLPWILSALAGQIQGRLQKEGQLLLGGK